MSHEAHHSLPGFPAGTELRVLEEVGSTNVEALRLAREGHRGPIWIMAERQTEGKGRAGRQWAPASGNLYASLLFSPDCAPAVVPQLSFVAGVALIDAVRALAGGAAAGVALIDAVRALAGGAAAGVALIDAVRMLAGGVAAGSGAAGAAAPAVAAPSDVMPGALLTHKPAQMRLKWPNDGLIDGRKFAGILCESVTQATGQPQVANVQVVVGIGINLAQCPENLTRPVTSLRAHGMNADPLNALAALAPAFAGWLDVWRDGKGFAEIRTAWMARAGDIGEPLTIHAGGPRVTGRYAGIDDNGALLLRGDDDEIRRYSFGDVDL